LQKYNILLTKPFVENPHTFISTLSVLKKLFYDSNKLTKTKSKQHIILKTDKK